MTTEQPQPTQPQADVYGLKIAAGICGILLGSLAIHKLILGYTRAFIITILIDVVTCGTGLVVMHLIGIVEGILYLVKPDEEFRSTYVLPNRREWF